MIARDMGHGRAMERGTQTLEQKISEQCPPQALHPSSPPPWCGTGLALGAGAAALRETHTPRLLLAFPLGIQPILAHFPWETPGRLGVLSLGGGRGGILGCHCGSVPQMGHLSVRSDEVFCTEGFFQGEKVSPVLVGTQRDVPHPPRSPHWGRTGWDRDKQNGGRMGWQQAG